MPKSHLPSDVGSPRRSSSADGDRDPSRPDRATLLRWLVVGVVVAGLALLLTNLLGPQPSEQLPYSEFLDRVRAGDVAEVTIDPQGRVEGELDDGSTFSTVIPTALRQEELTRTLREQEVRIEATAPTDGFWTAVVSFLPFLLIIAFFVWMSRRARGQLSQIRGISRSKAKVIDTERPDTTFEDIAGYEDVKQEITEVVDFLRDPSKYREVGAHGPGGMLLVGPPGTGKTLIARAVAGEADVPFLYATGSGFVEMLVGVGASRVRDLFEEARKRSPAIVFIDELDSIGRKRGSSTTIGSNNEQEQTLNELLSELDGFDPAEGIVVMAATNRPQLLDDALTRPGRFDRQIEVGLPILDDRVAILEVHTRDKQVADDLDLRRVARGTPGFSGADLENLCNEAAIFAVRDGRQVIEQRDFDDARDRVIIGRRRDTAILRPEEKKRVAVHEAGHALVAALSPQADPVSKVTIMPTGRALGVTHQLPLDEHRLHTEAYLRDMLAARLGGRVAERLVLGDLSSGAAQDLSGATQMATRMVRDLGFSDRVGPVGFHRPEDASVAPALRGRPYSEDTQRAIDEEVTRVLREAEKDAMEKLEQHRDELDELIARLLDQETVDGARIYAIVGREPPTLESPERGPA